jgi:glycosyltransferase involved in cell wall biosynthesis
VKYKIILNSHFFCSTSGGTDLFIKILNNILNNNKHEIFIVVAKNNFLSILKKIFFPFKEFLKQIIYLKKIKFKYWPWQIGSNEIYNFLIKKNKKNFKIIDADYLNIKKEIKIINPDIIFPCINPIPEFKEKNIGYIFDLQHEFFKKHFNKKDIEIRRKNIIKVLNYSKIIIVNSKHTIKTLSQKYKNYLTQKKIYSIPFHPNIPNNFFNWNWNLNLKKKYQINNKYFMICNQFWKHKNHNFAIKAFIKYCSLGGNYDLIMSGETNDKRFPEYFSEIKSIIYNSNFGGRIKMLGLIKKSHQISLLRNAQALIQPTLFEGGPGGGACNEAIALDVPVLASNIPVNLEIKSKIIKFFNPFKLNELSKLLLKTEKNKKLFQNLNLKSKSIKQNKSLYLFYEKIFNKMY